MNVPQENLFQDAQMLLKRFASINTALGVWSEVVQKVVMMLLADQNPASMGTDIRPSHRLHGFFDTQEEALEHLRTQHDQSCQRVPQIHHDEDGRDSGCFDTGGTT